MIRAFESCHKGLIEKIQCSVSEIRTRAFVLCTNFFPPGENRLLQLDTAETHKTKHVLFLIT